MRRSKLRSSLFHPAPYNHRPPPSSILHLPLQPACRWSFLLRFSPSFRLPSLCLMSPRRVSSTRRRTSAIDCSRRLTAQGKPYFYLSPLSSLLFPLILSSSLSPSLLTSPSQWAPLRHHQPRDGAWLHSRLDRRIRLGGSEDEEGKYNRTRLLK